MTEREWLCGRDVGAMLEYLRPAGPRKHRLLAAAFARTAYHLMYDRRARSAVEAAELKADGLLGGAEFRQAAEDMALAMDSIGDADLEDEYVVPEVGRGSLPDEVPLRAAQCGLEGSAEEAAENACGALAWAAVYPLPAGEMPGGLSAATEATFDGAVAAVRSRQPELIRCVFGNPFRPVAIEPVSLTPAVVSIARAAYDERLLPSGELDAARLAVLADALEDVGCVGEVLAHLRGQRHVRGCWVIDIILGLK